MFATLLGKGFTKFMNLFRKGNLSGMQINRENDFDINAMNEHVENSSVTKKQFKSRNESSGSSTNSFKNNLNFTPFHTDSPKENRMVGKKIFSNYKSYAYLNQLCKFYLNPPIDKIKDIINFRNSDSSTNLAEQELLPNQIKNRIFQFQKSANNPIEDRINSIQLKSFEGYLMSVLDGHGGDFVAEFVNNNLHIRFEERIEKIKLDSENSIDEIQIREALIYAYDQVEHEYYRHALEKFHNGEYKYAFIGSCVLCAVVHNNQLYVANSGDSKAKLFRREQSEYESFEPYQPHEQREVCSFIPIKISNTHNAGKPEEQKKLREKFKTEKDIIIDKGTACYVKGRLQPTKSIGDLFLKHKEFNEIVINSELAQKYAKKFLQNFNGPYIEHIPEVMRFELSEKDEFIVLASDGLWDWLDGYEVAKILDEFSLDRAKAVEELYKGALTKAANKINMHIDELENLPMSIRRSIYDDISIILVDLKNQTYKK